MSVDELAFRQRPRTPCFLPLPFAGQLPPVYQMSSDSIRSAILAHMQACFKHEVAAASGDHVVEPPAYTPLTAELAAECHDIASSLADALNNIRAYLYYGQEDS